jgi:hypothetical protein
MYPTVTFVGIPLAWWSRTNGIPTLFMEAKERYGKLLDLARLGIVMHQGFTEYSGRSWKREWLGD